jgi:hypothetical protein
MSMFYTAHVGSRCLVSFRAPYPVTLGDDTTVRLVGVIGLVDAVGKDHIRLYIEVYAVHPEDSEDGKEGDMWNDEDNNPLTVTSSWITTIEQLDDGGEEEEAEELPPLPWEGGEGDKEPS